LIQTQQETSLRGKEHEDMPVNGLLLTLSPDYQPLAVETSDVRSAHEFHEWLESQEGIGQVDVIYVGFEESNDTQP
jgi:hypothetical protein